MAKKKSSGIPKEIMQRVLMEVSGRQGVEIIDAIKNMIAGNTIGFEIGLIVGEKDYRLIGRCDDRTHIEIAVEEDTFSLKERLS